MADIKISRFWDLGVLSSQSPPESLKTNCPFGFSPRHPVIFSDIYSGVQSPLKRITFRYLLGSMKPFSQGEPGSLSFLPGLLCGG